MVNNSIQKKQNTSVVEYESNGEKVKLSPTTIRQYLVSGNGQVTDQEVVMFMSLCKYQKLNPFLKEAYLIKFGNSPATIVTGKDVFTKRAKRNPNYAGKQAGIIVEYEDGSIEEREGSMVLSNEKIVGGWAKIYIKGYEKPEYASVSFDEYAGKKADGTLNSQWKSKPATMIRKVAVVQALREAFPEDFGGLYSEEELSQTENVSIQQDTIENVEVVEHEEIKAEEQPKQETESVENILFNKEV